jgi:hypothetical protein
VETCGADEREMLVRMLDVQREEVARLLSDIDDTEARTRLVPSLTTPLGLVKRHQGPVSLRFIFGHMIAELARHAGHGDILVEQITARHDT